jgi:cellulose synthase operon protein C
MRLIRSRPWRPVMLAITIAALSQSFPGPADARSYVEDAQQSLKKGDLKAALIELRNAAREAPDDPKIRAQLADAYLRTGDAQSAEREALAALARKGDEADYLPVLAEALLRQGKFADLVGQVRDGDRAPVFESKIRLAIGIAELSLHHRDKAVPELRAAVRLDPSSKRAKVVLAQSLAATDVGEANSILDGVLAEDPQLVDAIEAKGAVLRDQGDLDGAMRRFDEVLKIDSQNKPARLSRAALNLQAGRFAAVDVDLDLILRAAPNDVQANYLRARERVRQKEYAKADEILTRISPGFDMLWEGYYLQGVTKFHLGQYAQAESVLAKYVAHVPEDANATRFAAIVALGRGAPTRAIGYLKPLTQRAPDDVAALGLLGDAYMATGKPDLALEQFEKAAAIEPDNPRRGTAVAVAEIGAGKDKAGLAELERVFDNDSGATTAGPALVLVALRAGQVDAAAAAAAKLVKADEKNALYQTLLGVVRVRQGDKAGAETALRAATALQPGSGLAARNLAHLYLAAERFDDAAKTYSYLLTKKPDDVIGLLGLAEVAAAERKWEQASDFVNRARGVAPNDPVPGIQLINLDLLRGAAEQAKVIADQLAGQFPQNPDVLDAQGRAQIAIGDNKGAMSTYKRAYQLAPASNPILSRYLSLLVAAKNFPEAQTVLQQAVDRSPTNASLKADLIRIEAQAGGVDAGIVKARSFAQADPSNTVYDVVAAELYEQAGRNVDAQELLEKTVAALPSDIGATLALASVYGRIGNPAKAEALLLSRLKDAPKDAVLHLALASTYQNQKKTADAIHEYEQVMAERPNDATTLNNLGWLYLQQGDLAKARDFGERALALAPHDGQIEDTLGWILLAQGDPAKALTYLTAANVAMPRDPTIQYHLAAALGRSGKSADAQTLLEKLLSSGAAFADKAEAEKLLEQLKRG